MKCLLLIPAILILTACAHTNANAPVTADVILDHRADYANAQNGRNLVVKPPLSDYLISHQFDV